MLKTDVNSYKAKLAEHLEGLAVPKVISVTQEGRHGRAVEFEILRRQGRIKINFQTSSGTNVIIGDDQSLKLLRTARMISQGVNSFDKYGEKLELLSGVAVEKVSDILINGLINAELSYVAFFNANAGNPYNGLGVHGKMVMVPHETGSRRLQMGSQLAHEMAHANGAGEYRARVIEAEYLNRNGLPAPSKEEILFICLCCYLNRQANSGEWRSWISQWWKEKDGVVQKLTGAAKLLYWFIGSRDLTS